jgi:hypothetical protein
MDKMIAYCGLTCTDCPAYKATQANDQAALEQVAAEWREMFNAPQITAESVVCDGCLRTDGRLSGYCAHCGVRACAMERGVVNCAHCGDYETCDTLAEFLTHAPEAKVTLDDIRSALAA